jgi:hypothetical protein
VRLLLGLLGLLNTGTLALDCCVTTAMERSWICPFELAQLVHLRSDAGGGKRIAGWIAGTTVTDLRLVDRLETVSEWG